MGVPSSLLSFVDFLCISYNYIIDLSVSIQLQKLIHSLYHSFMINYLLTIMLPQSRAHYSSNHNNKDSVRQKLPSKCNFQLTSITPLSWQTLLFFRLHIYLLLIILILSALSLYPIITNFQSVSLSTIELNYILTLTPMIILQNDPSSLNTLAIINLSIVFVVSVAVILVVFFGRRSIDNLLKDDEIGKYSPQGFSVLCKYDRVANFSEEEIVEMVKNWWQLQLCLHQQEVPHFRLNDLIEKVIFFFNVQLFESIKSQIWKLEDATEPKQASSQPIHNIFDKYNRIETLKQRIRNRQLTKTNKCIIIFKNQACAKYFLRKNKNNIICISSLNRPILPGQTSIRVYEAPYPKQTYYQKQHQRYFQTHTTKCCHRFFTWSVILLFAMTLVLGVGFGICYGWESNDQINWEAFYIVYLILILTFMEVLVRWTTKNYEIQPSRSRQQYSILIKTVYIYVLSLTVGVIVPVTISTTDTYIQRITSLIFWILLAINLLGPLRVLINYRTIKYYCSLKQTKGDPNLNTVQAHQLNEIPKGQLPSLQSNQYNQHVLRINNETSLQELAFQFGEQSSWIIYTFILNTLYGVFIPILVPIYSVSLLLHYFISKVVLTVFSPGVYPGGPYLHHKTLSILSFSPLLCSLSNGMLILYSHFIIFNQNQTLYSLTTIIATSSISFAISIITIFLVWLGLLTKQVPVTTNMLYKQCAEDYFCLYSKNVPMASLNLYEQENPIYMSNIINNKQVNEEKSEKIFIEELNTMSRSLEETLKEKLFKNSRVPILPSFNPKESLENSIYFEYQRKVEMPASKSKKPNIPPIFKSTREDRLLQKKLHKQKQKINENTLFRFNQLFESEDPGDEQLKKMMKAKIKTSISKIN